MNFIYPIHGLVGAFHVIVSILSLGFGSYILSSTKGTRLHKKLGYVYAVSMTLVITTAFMLYNLTGKFNMFHIAAIVSTVTLMAGMLPILLKKPRNSYLSLHFSFMYWSVIGLYGAFVSETLVRIPESPFWEMVGLATGAVMLVGGIVFGFKKKQWQLLGRNVVK